MNEKITIIVASPVGEQICDDYGDCGYPDFSQDVYSLDQLLNESWFIDLLEYKGFYSEKSLDNKNEHTNKYLYEYNIYCTPHYTNQLNILKNTDELIRVYQEVVGPEKIERIANWKKKREEYLAKQKEISARRRETLRLKKLEKAKKILEENK